MVADRQREHDGVLWDYFPKATDLPVHAWLYSLLRRWFALALAVSRVISTGCIGGLSAHLRRRCARSP